MRRSLRLLAERNEKLSYPPYCSFNVGVMRIYRETHLLPGNVYKIRDRDWVLPAVEFRELAIRLLGWVPRTLLDSRYRHPRRIRP